MPEAKHTLTLLPGGLSSEKILRHPAWATPGGASPDAELIRLCRRFEMTTRRKDALWETIEDDDERDIAQQPFHDELEALLPKILDTPALTIQGMKARARMVIAYDPRLREGDGQWNMDMLAALVRDLTPEIGS